MKQRFSAGGERLGYFVKVGFVGLLIWTAFGLLLGTQNVVNTSGGGRQFGFITWFAVARCWIYALLTPPVFWLTERYPFVPGQRRRSVAAHLLGATAFAIAYVGLRLILMPPVERDSLRQLPPSLGTGWQLMRSTFFELLWMYLSIVLVAEAMRHYRQSRQRALAEANFKTEFAEMQLEVLKLQLHPHFLFNTLNGIYTLMGRDVGTAREMILRLSDLLRLALARTGSKVITLRDELDFVDAYLQIEQMRFGPRLKVTLDIDPETLDARVPNMILQPLVENAIRHGIAARRAGGAIKVTASRQNGRLRIMISNDGLVSTTSLDDIPPGLGLRNTRARLLQLYGTAYNLRSSNRPEGGMELNLEVPYEEEPA